MAQAAAALKQIPDHGKRIFVYCNIRTKQTVYSLTRAMDNKNALSQIPFLVKKSKPAALRKDHWRPLCVIQLPTSLQGLRAYKQLREFQKRHYMEWDFPELALASKKKKARKLMDQKANSIADIAAVLLHQHKTAAEQAQAVRDAEARNQSAKDTASARLEEVRIEKRKLLDAGDEESLAKAKLLKAEKMRLVRVLDQPDIASALAGKWSPLNDKRPAAKRGVGRLRGAQERSFSLDEVRIYWDDILDAEYAADWPNNVVQDIIEWGNNASRYTGIIDEGRASQAPAIDDAAPTFTGTAETAEAPRSPESSESPDAPESSSRFRKFLDRLQTGRKDRMSV